MAKGIVQRTRWNFKSMPRYFTSLYTAFHSTVCCCWGWLMKPHDTVACFRSTCYVVLWECGLIVDWFRWQRHFDARFVHYRGSRSLLFVHVNETFQLLCISELLSSICHCDDVIVNRLQLELHSVVTQIVYLNGS